jgi:glutamyl-tRNA synthetase
MSLYFFTDTIEYDDAAVKKHLRPVILEPLTALYERLKTVQIWEKEHLQECVNDISAKFEINMAKIAQPLRVAVTGSGMSPSIDITLELLGKERVLTRLEIALQQLRIRAQAG